MPIVPEDELLSLLRAGTISALTIDTNIFDEKGLQLGAAPLATVATLRSRPFVFLLSGTVAHEVRGHIERKAEEALRSVRKAIGEALFAFETVQPTRDEILNQITKAHTPADAAQTRFAEYVDQSGCEILNDEELVTTKDLFESYFAGHPPFGTGKKKDEFPDALALRALDATATARVTGILVVSKDGDWRSFCEESQRLYLVPELETALSLLNDPPLVVRQAILTWLGPEDDGRADIQHDLENRIADLDVDIDGYATSGEMEAIPHGVELRSIDWPDDAEIDIIDTSEPDGNGVVSAVLSMPLSVDLIAHVELSFSVWDSIDRESISMGGRSIEYDETRHVRVTVTVNINDLGGQDQNIEFLSCEIDLKGLDVDLGGIDMFEPEDYYDDPDENSIRER